ncbi:MAG: efflux RND transporter periplasmic adaptor subunit [Vicinamibacterales bacterium]
MIISHRSRRMRALVAVFVLPLFWSCTSSTEPAPAEALTTPKADAVELSEEARANAGILVESARTVTRTAQLTAPGLLALDETRTARIGSLQEGLVLDARAQVGDRVRPRQLLATMHGHAVHDAWAGYHKAMAERRRADNQLSYAVDSHERARRLYADKAVSLQELQRADVDRVAAIQAVDVAKAEVTRSIEELEHIGITVSAAPGEEGAAATDGTAEQIPVRSPIGGVVLERLVTPGTTVTPGTPLFVVSELSTLWAVAEIDESQLSRVKVGRPVDVVVAAYPGERFAGTITFIADMVSPTTRRVTVRCTVPNPDGRLKPEMFATVSLGEGDPRAVVVVPTAAIQTLDGTSVVFVEQSSGRFVPRTVQLGAEAEGVVEVTSGLSADDPVVVGGSFVLKAEFLKARTGEN